MVECIDEKYPNKLLDAGKRPAAIVKIDNKRAETAEALKNLFDSNIATAYFIAT